ncbi:MAG: ATP-grasp domain-containing protein [Myxococcaceae bacterium]|nr:ATP-grasp domain-containing protein [Myxococcaceae bacterium]MCA3012295.1 ATP-grasp domain-containing protein [Myxococcaceae bacterium]
MPRNIVFVAPFPAEVTQRFVRAVARLSDVRLLGVVHTPPPGDDARVYDDLVRVERPLDTASLIEGVTELQRRHGRPARIIGILEAVQVQLAEVRAHFGVEGTPPKVAELFRDKSRMKAALAKAGLPVARNAVLRSLSDAKAFAERVGFPLVLKPVQGMGAKSTFRIRNVGQLLHTLNSLGVGHGREVLAEEFLRGREFSFETITVGGQVKLHSISQYLPTCLEAVENPWIQWCCLLPRDVTGPTFDRARRIGWAAIEALGLEDGVTHMEWFERPDGSLAIGEIAQRPPGANISLMTGLAHDFDLYRAWARAVVDGVFEAKTERKYAVGSAFLRGMGRGRVAQVTGVRETHEAVGRLIAEAKLPTLGAMRSDSYEGDGYVVLRDPDTEVVKRALKFVIDTVRVSYVED